MQEWGATHARPLRETTTLCMLDKVLQKLAV
jgi:hypothetical protein